MKTLNVTQMTLNLTPALPYLHALETAENFPALFIWSRKHERENELEEAMEEIDNYCPWLWPAIDNAIVELVSSR